VRSLKGVGDGWQARLAVGTLVAAAAGAAGVFARERIAFV
jgi:hypothetical protein